MGIADRRAAGHHLSGDARDANRAVAPLRPADDAVHIDTTGQGIDEVVQRVLAIVPAR